MNFYRAIKTFLLYISSILYRNHKSKSLYYHDFYKTVGYDSPDCGVVMGTPMAIFKQHLDVIRKEGYKIVPRISHSEGEVAIMLDDGFRGIWENRLFFYDNEIYPTIFLAHDLIGKPGFLNEQEILELQNHGFIFECHGWSHTSLAHKTDEQLEVELGESKKYLEKLLKKKITEICLPIGNFSNHLLKKVQDYDYEIMYSSIPGNFDDKIYGCLTPRILCQFATPMEVRLFLRGGSELIKLRYIKLHHFSDFNR